MASASPTRPGSRSNNSEIENENCMKKVVMTEETVMHRQRRQETFKNSNSLVNFYGNNLGNRFFQVPAFRGPLLLHHVPHSVQAGGCKWVVLRKKERKRNECEK